MKTKIFLAVVAVVFQLKVVAQVSGAPVESPPPVTAILGAFPEEIRLLLTKLDSKKERVIQKLKFTEGWLRGRKVVVAHSGIGKVNAAATTTLMIEHYRPKQIIFTGIAGGTDPTLEPGDIVIGTQLAYHDYGIIGEEQFVQRPTRNPATMADNPVYFNADSILLLAALRAAASVKLEAMVREGQQIQPRIVQGVIVTGDVFVASPIKVDQLRLEFKASATEMEGAAVAQVCWQQDIPLIVIRSLSDRADRSAASDVRMFYRIAAANSAELVVELVSLLGK
jgi:adenosylhomocysteine nucleosidase